MLYKYIQVESTGPRRYACHGNEVESLNDFVSFRNIYTYICNIYIYRERERVHRPLASCM